MTEASPKSETAVSRWRRQARKGQKALYVWLPVELINRVHERRRAEQRTLTAFVERALRGTVDLAERYAATAAPRRAQRR